jgi:Uma2 family endonuclease
MSTARLVHHSYEDYLWLEEHSLAKHEFCGGEIYAMAGGTPEHGALAVAIAAALRAQLPASCNILSSDVKVRISVSDLTTYPDVSVVCGSIQRDSRDKNAIVNPTVLVEVTSPSTQDYDRGEKLRNYKELASLKVVILVAHDEPRVTIISRQLGGWTTADYHATQIATSHDPAIALNVDELYATLKNL